MNNSWKSWWSYSPCFQGHATVFRISDPTCCLGSHWMAYLVGCYGLTCFGHALFVILWGLSCDPFLMLMLQSFVCCRCSVICIGLSVINSAFWDRGWCELSPTRNKSFEGSDTFRTSAFGAWNRLIVPWFYFQLCDCVMLLIVYCTWDCTFTLCSSL